MRVSKTKALTARLIAVLIASIFPILFTNPVQGQRRRDREEPARESRTEAKDERRFDDPADEEELNSGLWEFARGTPYKDILPYVAAEQRKSKNNEVAEAELPNGWRIAPAGRQIEVGRLPYEALPFAGKLVVLDTGNYYREPQEVSVVDTERGQVVKTLKINSLFPSAVVGLDGDLYISGGFDQKIFRVDKQFNIVRAYSTTGFTGGLAAIDARHLAFGDMAIKSPKGTYLNGRLSILNTETGKIDKQVDLGYFPYAVRFINHKLFVTLLGENRLLIYDNNLRLLRAISVGLTPQEMCTDGRLLYVVNTGADTLSVVDTTSNQLVSSIAVGNAALPAGTAPSSCAVDSGRLYVSLANTNQVEVRDAKTRRVLDHIPTGWYPTKVLIDNGQLIVLSAKGIKPRRPNPNGPKGAAASRVPGYVLNLLKGSAAVIPPAELQQNLGDKGDNGPPAFRPENLSVPIKHVFFVIKENRSYDQVLGDLGKGNGDPKLTLFGETVSPVHHQLARAFVTLDNFFVNGEISVLGHSFTTSGYASPFIEWLGNVSYSDRWKGYPFGTVPATMSPLYIWDRLDEAKVDYRIYGENPFLFSRAHKIFSEIYGARSPIARRFYEKTVAAAAGTDRGTEFNELAKSYFGQANSRQDAYRLLGNAEFARKLSQFLTGDGMFAQAIKRDYRLRRAFADYLYHYPFNYRSWDLKYSDLDRVMDWKKDFDNQLKQGKVAAFNYIWLPNDHTDGAKTTILNAFQFVAQNDAALARLTEIISHSPIWKDTLILVVEDDAQNGPDHVDATRTIAFAAGPYVKRGALVSDRYDQLSMLRTIELLLGLKPLNSTEQLAVPMFGIFTDQPDFQPFVPVEPSQHLAPADRERYQRLALK